MDYEFHGIGALIGGNRRIPRGPGFGRDDEHVRMTRIRASSASGAWRLAAPLSVFNNEGSEMGRSDVRWFGASAEVFALPRPSPGIPRSRRCACSRPLTLCEGGDALRVFA